MSLSVFSLTHLTIHFNISDLKALRFWLQKWVVHPKCTVSCCAVGNTSPPEHHQHPSSSCVVHHPTHSLSISPSLSFTPWLHIDLNSFVSYWSTTPPSAALNKHKDTHHAHTSLTHALVQLQPMHALYKYADVYKYAEKPGEKAPLEIHFEGTCSHTHTHTTIPDA